jgi:hypothetical protein
MSEGDLCPRCEEEIVNCTCRGDGSSRGGTGPSSHTTYNEDGEVELYDGWYDPGK